MTLVDRRVMYLSLHKAPEPLKSNFCLIRVVPPSLSLLVVFVAQIDVPVALTSR